MIGNKDSGKTTYMVSAYGAMKAGKYGFSVYGDLDTDAWLMQLYSQIQNGQYPMPSVKREQFDFNLYYYQQQVLSFQWVDYFGGVISEVKSQELAGDIDASDAIMIFLDASALVCHKHVDTKLRRILYLIGEKLADTERTFDVLAVVTKYDLVGNAYPFEEVTKPLETLKTMLSHRDNIHFRTVPVSCTDQGFMNVDLPLIDILYHGLRESRDYHQQQSLEYEKLAKKYYRSSGILDWMLSKLLRVKTNGELARESRVASVQEQNIWQELETALNQLNTYRETYKITIPEFTGTYAPQSEKRNSRFINI